jgi:hypothetical protein
VSNKRLNEEQIKLIKARVLNYADDAIASYLKGEKVRLEMGAENLDPDSFNEHDFFRKCTLRACELICSTIELSMLKGEIEKAEAIDCLEFAEMALEVKQAKAIKVKYAPIKELIESLK